MFYSLNIYSFTSAELYMQSKLQLYFGPLTTIRLFTEFIKKGGRVGEPGVKHENEAFSDRTKIYSTRPKMPPFHAAENSLQAPTAQPPYL